MTETSTCSVCDQTDGHKLMCPRFIVEWDAASMAYFAKLAMWRAALHAQWDDDPSTMPRMISNFGKTKWNSVPEHKLVEWFEIERNCCNKWEASTVLARVEEWNGEPLLWFIGDDIHVDAAVWCECYELPETSDNQEISDHIEHLLGKVQMHFERRLL